MPDPHADWAHGRLRSASGWPSIQSGSMPPRLFCVVGAACTFVDSGGSRYSLVLADCASSQLEHLVGEARQQLSMALRLPPLGHEGLRQRCSTFV